MQEVPKRPWAAKTMRSAVTPAPELGSKPAMVSTVFGLNGLDMVRGCTALTEGFSAFRRLSFGSGG